MSHVSQGHAFIAMCLAILVVSATGMAGCSDAGQSGSSRGTEAPAESPAAEAADEAEVPEYTSWKVYINDDDSYQKDGITYSIALNLTADNPTPDPAGTYSGEATAKSDSTGEYMGQTLNASAVAKSSKLEFTLADPAGEELASLTGEQVLSGTGTIAMQASGSGTYGKAGGAFGNNSSQPLEVSVSGSDVTLSVVIDGHKYTFTGTLTGES